MSEPPTVSDWGRYKLIKFRISALGWGDPSPEFTARRWEEGVELFMPTPAANPSWEWPDEVRQVVPPAARYVDLVVSLTTHWGGSHNYRVMEVNNTSGSARLVKI